MGRMLSIVITIFILGETAGMEIDGIDWWDVATKTQVTSPENPPCSSAIRFLEGSSSVDWGDIEQYALGGDPISQYCMALKCDSLAKVRYNGERKKLRRSEAVFLLLSSKKGNYERAQVALDSLLSPEITVNLENTDQMNEIVNQIVKAIDGNK